jgi:phage tail-like protein
MEAALIAKLLPAVIRAGDQDGSVLHAALAVMEGFLAPAEAALAALDQFFDPRRAPDAFLLMTAAWAGLEPYLDERDPNRRGGQARLAIDLGNLRELVVRAAAFGRLRGTRDALLQMLEIATGLEGFAIIEEPLGADGRPVPFHFQVKVPAAAHGFRALIARIVEREKPAYSTAEIVYAQE